MVYNFFIPKTPTQYPIADTLSIKIPSLTPISPDIKNCIKDEKEAKNIKILHEMVDISGSNLRVLVLGLI